uniref:Beta-glucosidase 44 n=1 Tax=Aegilops tauschii TaxID=37682 RepID=N1QU62_AEGTA
MELLRAVVLLSLALLANGRDTDLSRDSFPKGFVFGTASSAYQVEGNSLKYGRGPCIWDTFLKFPGATPDNATANVTVDEYHRYMDDVDSMVRVGFDAYRFSISWSRIFPNGIGRFNKDGVDYYHRLIDYMLANNITPYVVLYHYDLPEVLNNQYNGWLSPKVVYMHPITFGHYPETMRKLVGSRLPNFTAEQSKLVQGSADIIGVNHYTTYYVRHHENLTHMSYATDWQAELLFERNGVPIGRQAFSKWLYVVPWGFYKAVMHVKNKFRDPLILIGENGIDQSGSDTLPHALYDTFRIDYFDQYLHELKRAIADGARVTGYFAWSLLDNFEWRMGFTSKFGLVYVDRKTFTRYPKDSTRWFRKVIKSEEY